MTTSLKELLICPTVGCDRFSLPYIKYAEQITSKRACVASLTMKIGISLIKSKVASNNRLFVVFDGDVIGVNISGQRVLTFFHHGGDLSLIRASLTL